MNIAPKSDVTGSNTIFTMEKAYSIVKKIIFFSSILKSVFNQNAYTEKHRLSPTDFLERKKE